MNSFFCVYKITNLINNKIYVGIHVTSNLDDGYMGSGSLIKRAIKKYGIANFKRENLAFFDNKEDMLKMEAEIVNTSFIQSDNTYNMCEGGSGGSSFNYKILKEHNIVKYQQRIDTYNKTPKICPQCKEAIPYKSRVNIYCSSSCSAIFNNTLRASFTIKKEKPVNKKITKQEQYIKDPTKCKCCNSVITFTKRRNLFCNRSCKASYTNHHRDPVHHSDETKEKISKSKKLNYLQKSWKSVGTPRVS
jgi:hypothetical protein